MLILLYFMFILPYRLGFQLEPEGTAAFLDVVIGPSGPTRILGSFLN